MQGLDAALVATLVLGSQVPPPALRPDRQTSRLSLPWARCAAAAALLLPVLLTIVTA